MFNHSSLELTIDQAKQHLNWEPRYTLMTTLPTIIKNLQANPLVWYKENDLELPEKLKAELPDKGHS